MLTNIDLTELTDFRRELHRHPELSGEEVETASKITAALRSMSPTRILTGLGGHGVAAIFDSGKAGPTVLFRAELDALPIEESNNIAWASQTTGKSHVCGHDGHMTMLLGLGRMISRQPVAQGRVILMFQPAEEDGSGAKAVVADPMYQEIQADWAFAIHVEPGRPFGYVSTCEGLINCASLGLKIRLLGKTAHAADPEDGVSPAQAIAKLIPSLDALGQGGPLDDDFRLVTITHVKIGEPSFGVAPGEGEVFATLRTTRDEGMKSLETKARKQAIRLAEEFGLSVDFEVCDNFASSINDPDACAVLQSMIQMPARLQQWPWKHLALPTAIQVFRCAHQKTLACLAGMLRLQCYAWGLAKTMQRCTIRTMIFPMICSLSAARSLSV